MQGNGTDRSVFLSADIVDEFNEKGASVIEGDFGEMCLFMGLILRNYQLEQN